MRQGDPTAEDLQELDLVPLPLEVLEISKKVAVPPRLIAHLTLVHDVARRLLQGIRKHWPALSLDGEAILFGAAIHDIGKAQYPKELSQPGNRHEAAGRQLLGQLGIADARARFTETHAWAWDEPKLTLEDLLVALADHCWKGKRTPELEEEVVRRVAGALGLDFWDVYPGFSELLDQLSLGAEARLAWQNRFSVKPAPSSVKPAPSSVKPDP